MAYDQQASRIETVITAPAPFDTYLASKFGVRTTIGVLTQLFASAREYLIIGSPFLQGGKGLYSGSLGMALYAAINRGVRVDLISTGRSLARLDLTEITGIQGARIRTFQPKSNFDNPQVLGSHAKFCISDSEHAYIGSANITEKGISEHLEIGLLVHGKPARDIFYLLEAVIESEYLVQDFP